MRATLPLRWRPTAQRARLLTLAAVAFVLAFATGHVVLLVLVAPLLVLAVRTARPPDRLDLEVTAEADRCFEDDEVALAVTLRLPVPVDQVAVRLRADDTVEVLPARAQSVGRTDYAALRWWLRPARWGRYRVEPVTVTLVAGGRTLAATVAVHGPELAVYPRPVQAAVAVLPPTLPRRMGEHAMPVPGSDRKSVV